MFLPVAAKEGRRKSQESFELTAEQTFKAGCLSCDQQG
jgi:hypothetical protein